MIARTRFPAAFPHPKAVFVALVLPALLAMSHPAVAAQPCTMRWAASPLRDPQGRQLPPAVAYEVWLRADAGPESLVAIAPDTFHVLNLTTEVTYIVRVRALSSGGLKSEFSPPSDPIRLPGIAGAQDEAAPGPRLVGPAIPNPFNARTTIAYRVPDGLAAGARLELGVYDLRGRHVADLALDRNPGRHVATWHGSDKEGRPVPAGVYLARFECGTRQETLKLVLVA